MIRSGLSLGLTIALALGGFFALESRGPAWAAGAGIAGLVVGQLVAYVWHRLDPFPPERG